MSTSARSRATGRRSGCWRTTTGMSRSRWRARRRRRGWADMRVVVFCHSLLSDWNHGNAHFLRGVTSELIAAGHQVQVYEPHDAWSRANLLADAGPTALAGFHAAYPQLSSVRY